MFVGDECRGEFGERRWCQTLADLASAESGVNQKAVLGVSK